MESVVIHTINRRWIIWALLGAMIMVQSGLGYSWGEGKMVNAVEPLRKSDVVHEHLEKSWVLPKVQDSRNPFIPLTSPVVPAQKATRNNQTDLSKGIFTNSPSKLNLLGIVHGQHAPHAVIRLSDGKRLVVSVGSKLADSGWKVKRIQKSYVVLERLSTSSDSPLKSSKERILRFSSLLSS